MSNRETREELRDLDVLIGRLREVLPGSHVSKDFPDVLSAEHWLDVKTVTGTTLQISWRPRAGYGLYCKEDSAYGEGPDEVYDSIDALLARICEVANAISARAKPARFQAVTR